MQVDRYLTRQLHKLTGFSAVSISHWVFERRTKKKAVPASLADQ